MSNEELESLISSMSEKDLQNLLSKLPREKVELIVTTGKDDLGSRDVHSVVKDYLQSEEKLISLLRSDAFTEFCNEYGYTLSKDDIIEVTLPKFLKLFTGGINNA